MIGAFYQCYKNKRSLNFVLTEFRKFNDDSNIVLVSDGGDDMTPESSKFNCIYEYRPNLRSFPDEVSSGKEFIMRILNSLDHIKEDFFILLEDDVWIMSDIKSELKYDINGCNKNEFLPPGIVNIIKERNINFKYIDKIWYGGSGGCIFKKDFFKEISKDINKLENDLKMFFNNIKVKISNNSISGYKNVVCSYPWGDQLLTYLTLINGGKIGPYDGYCETWYKDLQVRKEKNNIEVLHQYKELYDK